MQGQFNIHTPITVIYSINIMKDINHMIISVDAEKALEKNKHLFMKKNSQQSGYRGNIIQHIKTIYNKPEWRRIVG